MPQDIRERTFQFAIRIIELCRKLDGKSDTPRVLTKQLLRAGTSVGANLEEGHAAQSRADFVNKYSIALKEAREAHYWLRLISASIPTAEGLCAELLQEIGEISRILGSIIVKTKAKS